MLPSYSIFPLGDAALTIEFGNTIHEETNRHVLRLFQTIKTFSPHILDLVPAYGSLTVYYDVFSLHSKQSTAFEAMKAMIASFLHEEAAAVQPQSRQVRIPVSYAEKFAPDIDELAIQKNLSVGDVIRLHTAKAYRVYMIGFLPGFAYMGGVDARIAAPRKAQPRTAVPAGSVGIAGEQTGIYPLASPGGWNIIGRTPLTLFDATKEEPVLLHPGDEVSFYSITEDEFKDYQNRNA